MNLLKAFSGTRHPVLGYLFERFPSYTQTFCTREVLAVRRLTPGPEYSIRRPDGEPSHEMFGRLEKTIYLPAKFDEILAGDSGFRRAARKHLDELIQLWGDDAEKHRIYESLWLLRECREAGVTHLHTHFAGIGARTAFWLRRLGGPTYSVTAHANDIFRDEPPERLGQVLQAAACVVTVSDFSRRYLVGKYPALEPTLHRVYNGIGISSFRVSDIPEGRPLFLSVGRLIEKKGLHDLVEACARMTDVDFECRIIGEGPLEEVLRERIAAHGLGHKVSLAGPKTTEEIIEAMRSARGVVLPCVTAADGAMDNLPTVIMEAMAAGLPVVSTPLAGIPEMVVHGQTGFLVPEGDVEALAGHMGKLAADRSLARSLGQAGRAHCQQHFALESTSKALVDVFTQHGVLEARS